MRRGKLNKISYITIIVSAFFTILAYVSDQLVINYENKMRILNLKYQNLSTEIKSLEKTISTFDTTGFKKDSLIYSEIKQRNFFLKNIILLAKDNKTDFADEYLKMFRGEENEYEWAIKNIKARAINSVRYMIWEIDDIIEDYRIVFNNPIFEEIDTFSKEIFLKKFNSYEDLYNYNLDKFNNKNFKNFEDILFTKNISRTLELADWSSIRNYKLLILENLYKETEKLNDISDYLSKVLEDKEIQLNVSFIEVKTKNKYKNYFILMGIISQILTLFFLLLLFRNLIKQKVI
jgi:PAS domain-containing protein